MSAPTLLLSSILAAGLLFFGGAGAVGSATPPPAPSLMTQGGQHPYGTKSLRGAHGFTYSGSHKVLGAIASTGRIDFDGQGGCHARFSTSVNGTTFTGTFDGTYSVNPDGTGSIVIQLPWLSMQGHGSFVLIDEGKGTYFMSVDAGYSVTGSTRLL